MSTNASSRTKMTANGVRTLQDLLAQVVAHPERFSSDSDFRSALKSQGALASLDRTIVNSAGLSIKTYTMSLNTLKTYADSELSDGFKGLNALRVRALEALEIADKREVQANKRSKSGLTRKVAQLEQELEMHRRTHEILLRSLSAAMSQFISIRDASDEKLRAKRTQDALQLLRTITSMNMSPFNIIPLAPDFSTPSSSPVVTDINSYRK